MAPTLQRRTDDDPTEDAVPARELLALLSDDAAREILQALVGAPKPVRTLVEETSISRTTVYRRLDCLQDVGLVDTGMAYDPDGHHCTTFRATVERAKIELGDDGVVADLDGTDS